MVARHHRMWQSLHSDLLTPIWCQTHSYGSWIVLMVHEPEIRHHIDQPIRRTTRNMNRLVTPPADWYWQMNQNSTHNHQPFHHHVKWCASSISTYVCVTPVMHWIAPNEHDDAAKQRSPPTNTCAHVSRYTNRAKEEEKDEWIWRLVPQWRY